MVDTPETFVCAQCFRIQERSSEEECLKEMRETFGDVPEEEREIVCDDCYEYLTSGKNDLIEHFNKCHNIYSPLSEYGCDIPDCWWRLHENDR